MGYFIVIEGLDASGKATQSRLLTQRLNGHDDEGELSVAIRLESPDYTTPVGQLIDGHLKGKWFAFGYDDSHPGGGHIEELRHPQDAIVFQAMQTIGRYENAPALRKLLKENHVVHDRYFMSGEVYGRVDGLPKDWLWAIHESLPQPDLALFLDVSLEESMARRPERRDRYEANAEFLGKVRGTYQQLFAEREKAGMPYRTIDGHGTVEEVAQRIWDAVTLNLVL